MFEFAKGLSRAEEALMLFLATAAGFVPSALLIALAVVGRDYDPKFGYLGSVQLIAMLMGLIGAGAVVAVVVAAMMRTTASGAAHVALGALAALVSYALFRLFTSTSVFPSDFSILARLLSAQFALAVFVFGIELFISRYGGRNRSSRAAV